MKKLLITIPCYNEELVIEKNTITIMEYAKTFLSNFDWRILIIDNNSKDQTLDIAKFLEIKYPNKILIFEEKTPGRGIAVRNAWLKHKDFDIYSYMDADLATDIVDFKYLVIKVNEGYDLVTGSRYINESDIERNFTREVMSRVYNFILQIFLKVSFKDAQCGFKAMSAKMVKELFPKTEDNGWFWDTELMILAVRGGYKVLEVPVSWKEKRDELRRSKVSPFSEALRQLKNIWKMQKKLKIKKSI